MYLVTRLIRKYFCKLIAVICISFLIISLFNSENMTNNEAPKTYNTGEHEFNGTNHDRGTIQAAVDSHLCFNTFKDVMELKPCIYSKNHVLPNKPFGIENCSSDKLPDFYKHFPQKNEGDNENVESWFKNKVYPWAKEQDNKLYNIYDTSENNELKCNRGDCHISDDGDNATFICKENK
jgi:hypothetical protein